VPLTLPASAPEPKTMNTFVGLDVTKEFSGEQFYNGKVVSCDEGWFQVKYTDGEEEDYSLNDVIEGIMLFRAKNKTKR
jgi:hypothetical protein